MTTTYLIFEAGVFEDEVFSGYTCPTISHIDIVNKRIHLNAGITTYHPVDHIYKEMRFIRATDASVRRIKIPITAEGAIPKGGGKFTPRLAVLRYGWRIAPHPSTTVLYIAGEQITDDGQAGPACMDTAGITGITIHYEPATAEMLTGSGGASITAADVWSHPARSLTDYSGVWSESAALDLTAKMNVAAAILRNKTITDPDTGLMTVFADDGVTPLFTAILYEGKSATQVYRGQGAERRERLA